MLLVGSSVYFAQEKSRVETQEVSLPVDALNKNRADVKILKSADNENIVVSGIEKNKESTKTDVTLKEQMTTKIVENTNPVTEEQKNVRLKRCASRNDVVAEKNTKNIFSKNNQTSLNHSGNVKSNYQILKDENTSNFQKSVDLGNNVVQPTVFSLKQTENTEAVKQNVLSILDYKPYGLLSNHFKKIKLKNVAVPKTEEYFKEKKPLEMYLSVMPLLNYYTITPNGNDANLVHSIAVNDDADRLGFYAQTGLIFTLSDNFKLRTGLTFTKTNHSIDYRIRTDSLVVQSSDNKGVDISFAELNKTYSQSANYLGTKIELQYIFLRGEALTHYVNVGVEGAFRLNGNHQFNGFANIAYGVTRQIGDNAYLFIEPTFSYSLNQQSDNNSFLLIKPNKIGFNIGVNFKIK
jgi:glutaredoxin 2